mgnify:CR=1 FL=1
MVRRGLSAYVDVTPASTPNIDLLHPLFAHNQHHPRFASRDSEWRKLLLVPNMNGHMGKHKKTTKKAIGNIGKL